LAVLGNFFEGRWFQQVSETEGGSSRRPFIFGATKASNQQFGRLL
jgi:hypothetical protein